VPAAAVTVLTGIASDKNTVLLLMITMLLVLVVLLIVAFVPELSLWLPAALK
jgi:hypothetical protein